MLTSLLTPKAQLDQYAVHAAYIEQLAAPMAPTLTIDANPDGFDESIQLVFINDASLARVKTVLLAEIKNSVRLLKEEIAGGGSLPGNENQ